ncbi:Ceramide synthase 1 [Lamellibrachia satsuma]|nr:Ceramide synthase 1 [Lamellibrachia satsuma]
MEGELVHFCNDIYWSIFLATVLTLVRYILTATLFTPLASWLCLKPINQRKFPESSWKATYYGCMWSYVTYLLIFSGRYDFFHKPYLMWQDWRPHIDVPTDILYAYAVEFSFYVHSIYGTLYMDRWRKDSVVMILHHILSVFLLGFSYSIRYYKVGILIIFLHDIADVWLELTKVAVYLKDRNGKYYAVFDYISIAGFVIFGASWFLCRLYWFPLKVLHTTGHAVFNYAPPVPVPFYFFFNVMLWILLGLNVYWFMFILNLIYRVATGQMKEVDDVRESEVEERIQNIKNNKICQNAVNNSKPIEVMTNGVSSGKKHVE